MLESSLNIPLFGQDEQTILTVPNQVLFSCLLLSSISYIQEDTEMGQQPIV